MLIDCSGPPDLSGESATDEEVATMVALEQRGNTRRTTMEDDEYFYEYWPTTPRGRLAIACYDATNARVLA